jgi:hypothetical protein
MRSMHAMTTSVQLTFRDPNPNPDSNKTLTRENPDSRKP